MRARSSHFDCAKNEPRSVVKTERGFFFPAFLEVGLLQSHCCKDLWQDYLDLGCFLPAAPTTSRPPRPAVPKTGTHSSTRLTSLAAQPLPHCIILPQRGIPRCFPSAPRRFFSQKKLHQDAYAQTKTSNFSLVDVSLLLPVARQLLLQPPCTRDDEMVVEPAQSYQAE